MANEEKIRFKIDAEDRATAKLRKVTAEVENNVKKVRDVGQSAKSSTELVGTLASAMGEAELGGYAGQLAGITERVREFAEQAKAGGAGALVFKAGLAAAVGVLSFEFTKALSGANQANENFQKGLEKSKELMQETFSARDNRQRDQEFQLSLIRDPEKQKAELQRLINVYKTELRGAQDSVSMTSDSVNDMNTAWNRMVGNKVLKSLKLENEQANESVRDYTKRIAGLQNQLDKLKETEKGNAEATKQANKAIVDEMVKAGRLQWQLVTGRKTELDIQLEQARLLGADDRQIEHLVNQNRLITEFKEKQAAAAKQEQLAADKQRKADQIKQQQASKAEQERKSRESVLRNLNLQIVAMRDGEAAAQAMRLQMQGFDAATANGVAGLQAQIKKIEAAKKAAQGASAGALTSSDQRLITGRGETQRNILVEVTRDSAAKRDKLLTQVVDQLSAISEKEGVTLNVIGD